MADSAAGRIVLDQDELDKAAKEADAEDEKADDGETVVPEAELKGIDVGTDADERRNKALAALHAAQRKLNKYSPNDDSSGAKKAVRNVRKLAVKVNVAPNDAMAAAYLGERAIQATGVTENLGDVVALGNDDDEDDADEVDAEEQSRVEASEARMTITERATRTEARLRQALDGKRRRRTLAGIFIM